MKPRETDLETLHERTKTSSTLGRIIPITLAESSTPDFSFSYQLLTAGISIVLTLTENSNQVATYWFQDRRRIM